MNKNWILYPAKLHNEVPPLCERSEQRGGQGVSPEILRYDQSLQTTHPYNQFSAWQPISSISQIRNYLIQY
jgi:hypothetical protein